MRSRTRSGFGQRFGGYCHGGYGNGYGHSFGGFGHGYGHSLGGFNSGFGGNGISYGPFDFRFGSSFYRGTFGGFTGSFNNGFNNGFNGGARTLESSSCTPRLSVVRAIVSDYTGYSFDSFLPLITPQ